ncbi:MAG: aminotransferase class V-fold PLP-dependent enzyme [Acidimicrobiales bacterium]
MATPAGQIDVERVRADTPGCSRWAHLNNAGAALITRPVLNAVVRYLQLEADIGGYEAESATEEALERTYRSIASLLNCGHSEIALTSGASDAWWRAFQAVPLAPGDRILASRAEYNANAFALMQARRSGVVVELVPDDPDGQLDVDRLVAMLDPSVKLIAVTHMPTSSGLVNPVEEIGRAVADHDALYLVDACQSVGQRPVDVKRVGCDMLTFTARKFVRGPRGVGALYVRSEVMSQLDDPTFIDSRSADWISESQYRLRVDARRFELFEASFGARVGFGTAVDYALDVGLDLIQDRIALLAGNLRSLLAATVGVTLLDRGSELSALVTFAVDGRESTDVVAHLRSRGVNTSVVSSRTAQLDLGSRNVSHGVRASVHYYNTDAELEQLVDAVSEFAAVGRV